MISNVLLAVLLIVCAIGAFFTTVVALGVGAMCQENKKDIRDLRDKLDKLSNEFGHVKEFNEAVADCITNIGEALDVINSRTDWLSDIDQQIYNSFGQNKDAKKS